MTEILDILRRAKAGDGVKRIVRATGTSRNTVRGYLKLAKSCGFDEATTSEQLEEVASAVFRGMYIPAPPAKLEGSLACLIPHLELLGDWLNKDGLTLTKAHIKLERMGVKISYSSLYRYAREELGFGSKKVTIRMADTAPGEVAQADFGRLGMVYDPETGKNRVLHALVVTLVFSRHQYVYTTFSQRLDALIDGVESAWDFFGGVARRLIIDNMKVAVVKADRYEPIFTRVFMEYSEHRGFIIDPAVVRHPEGKGTVENQIRYVRENFFKGDTFTGRDHVQGEAELWLRTTAGLRIHGTTRKRPLFVFEQEEQGVLLPLTKERFDTPVWAELKVHPDHHVRFKNALYSLPTQYVGRQVSVKGTKSLVRIYFQNQLIKTHPVMTAGKRSTDFGDYPKEKSAYAMRDVEFYKRKASDNGERQGAFMAELLGGTVPWTYIRQAQQLLRLKDKYGAPRVETACSRALCFGLINVSRVEGIIRQSLNRVPSGTTGAAIQLPLPRFQRAASYFTHNKEKDNENKP